MKWNANKINSNKIQKKKKNKKKRFERNSLAWLIINQADYSMNR